MGIKRKDVELLNTSDSWKSPVSVIAHIDLDAFYAQCLGVRINADPKLPLGCRQWNAVIAVNYPARDFGIKRGMMVDECRKLCPDVLLPHVATFKKGELEWGFHENPQVGSYKVSLDYFRRESRKIFEVFRKHFKAVQKAGIDEGYVDLGPDVYKVLLEKKPQIFSDINAEELELTYDELIDIGAELVRNVRLEIFEQLRYTCSAGIAPNKMMAKLGSGFNKPFNQTVVYPEKVNEFLSHFPLTKIGGWRGKIGKHVEDAIDIPEDCKDQCEFIRDHYSISRLEKLLDGDVGLAKDVYNTVRGGSPSEVESRTSVKSMIAVKNFRGNAVSTEDDVNQWLMVYAADIAGRLADLDPTDGTTVVPKTISVRKMGQSKQKPFELKGLSINEIRDQIYHQSVKMCKGFITLPCSYMASEISNFYEIPRERLVFQNFKARESVKSSSPSPSYPNHTPAAPSIPDDNAEQEKHKENTTSLFVEDEERCDTCGEMIPYSQLAEHTDWHFAKSLQESERKELLSSPSKQSTKRVPSQSPVKKSKKKKVGTLTNQKNIMDFFKK